jgi:hypothetical protein
LDIDEGLAAVSWQDGDHAQLAAVTAEDLLEEYKQLRITMCKHNPGRTGVEQACDLTPIFMLLKYLEKIMTCKNEPSPLKEVITKALIDHIHQIKLKPMHNKALIDFLSCLPEMLQKAVSKGKIRKGFLASGMIDEGSLEMPDLYKMIGTCTRTPTQAEFDLIEKSFPVLLQEVYDHGRIAEETFDRLGFEPDINMFGKEAPRVAEITNEPCQRAKILSHHGARELRLAHAAKVEAAKDAKKADAEQKILDHQTRAEECRLLVLKAMGDPDAVLANAKVEHFGKAKVDQLKSFILVRTSGDAAISGGQRILKGTVDGANSGIDSWLTRAFDLRAKDLQRSETVPTPNTEVTSNSITSDPDCLTIRVARVLEPPLFQITIEWQKRVKAAVDSLSTNGDCSLVTIDAQQKQSDALCRILFSRLNEHIKLRVTDSAKRIHWVWDFVRNNLSRMASIMVLMNHIQDDLEAMGRHRDRYFLRHCEAFTPISVNTMQETTTEIRNHEGCYLYYDCQTHAFIRSGKVVFRSFDARHK